MAWLAPSLSRWARAAGVADTLARAQWPQSAQCGTSRWDGVGWTDLLELFLLLLCLLQSSNRREKTGLKREHATDGSSSHGHGRLKRHRPDGQAPDSLPLQQQQESRPYSALPHQEQPYAPARVLPGDEQLGRSLGHRVHDPRGIPVNHLGLGLGPGNLVGTSTTSDDTANYHPPHLSLHHDAHHGRPDAPASSSGAHSGPPRRESNPPALILSQDTLPPFVSGVARERGLGRFSAKGVPGGWPAKKPQRSLEEPRASPDDCSSPPEDVLRGAAVVTGANSVRLERGGLLSNFQTWNRGADDSSEEASQSESSESEDDASEDDAKGDSDEFENDQDDSSHLSQGEEADIELEDAVDVEEESSSEDEDLGFENHEPPGGWRQAATRAFRASRNDRTVDNVARTLQASHLDDSDSDTDSSSSSSSDSSSSDENQRHRSPDQGYDTADEELAEEYHRAEFAYDDDDDKVDLIRQKYGPPSGEAESAAPDEDTQEGRRRALMPLEREDVRITRLMGACVRCRLQKIKVHTHTHIYTYLSPPPCRAEKD